MVSLIWVILNHSVLVHFSETSYYYSAYNMYIESLITSNREGSHLFYYCHATRLTVICFMLFYNPVKTERHSSFASSSFYTPAPKKQRIAPSLSAAHRLHMLAGKCRSWRLCECDGVTSLTGVGKCL